jgi:hypothetical protein
MSERARVADTSVFAAVDDAFTRFASPPGPVGLDCAPYAEWGLPAGIVSLRELRRWMLSHRRAYGARNAIWRDLIGRARKDPQWMTATIGMALPALVRAAGHISRGFRGDRDDIDAEMLAAFIAAVRDGVDIAADRLYDRLRWHAVRAGIAVRNDDRPYQLVPDVEQLAGAAPQLPYGHPDLIVARAVATDILDPYDAELIMATRLDRTPLEAIAAREGIDAAVLRMRRLRAERVLVDAVHSGLLSGAISTGSRRRLQARAVTRTAVRAARAA